MSGPPDLKPRAARDRWLDKLRVEKRGASVSTYHYRLKLFVEWAEEQGIERMRDLSGWELESYENFRRSQDLSPITLNKEMGTLRNWLEYCARIEVVPEDLPEKIDPPDVPKDAESSDVMLHHEEAKKLLTHYRENPELRGTRQHVLLAIAWTTGARMGAIRALDLRDFHVDDGDDGPLYYLTFANRPSTDTPLKKSSDGERAVSLPKSVGKSVQRYVLHHRNDVYDDYSRQPLITTQRGRASKGTIRNLMYLATQPCNYGECPHGKERPTCDWRTQSQASQCPSSRAPHHVRTGAITWMLHRGVPVEVVAKRVNSSVSTIEKHYDKPDPIEEMRARRASYLPLLEIDPEEAEP
ncbi:tyrosine-type recombinase/integrase [Haloarcula pellucida]|uniref:Integrase n=1 Tax=Haloarcula pellucida TaxID=1427151 RepID=A0A830GMN6_9EURY|nr:site-specific integrase [Halomicroarcula pellucida]MBX0348226.1 site-specific integrase [Halomicroarcula pellucida]GGN97583.1 integrase [Halomicroarcula pellucida]